MPAQGPITRLKYVPCIGTTAIFHLIGSLEIHAEYTVIALIVAAWVVYIIKAVRSWISMNVVKKRNDEVYKRGLLVTRSR